MIKMQVWIDDYSEDSSTELFLPDNDLSSKINLEHDIVITETESTTDFGIYNLSKLNEILLNINNLNPDLSLESLEELFKLSGRTDISDETFITYLNDGDYLCDDITEFIIEKYGDYEGCDCQKEVFAAMYLFLDKHIPFTRNISITKISEIIEELIYFIDWDYIWSIYEQMGFKVSEIDGGTSVIFI